MLPLPEKLRTVSGFGGRCHRRSLPSQAGQGSRVVGLGVVESGQVVDEWLSDPRSQAGKKGRNILAELPWFLAGGQPQSSPQCLPVSATALCASIIILDFLLAAASLRLLATTHEFVTTCPGVPRVPSSFSSPRRRRRRR